jgi:ABC-type sugar transport system ATPase subunit
LQQELGITSVLVTHDQSEALAMADRVAVFREGVLLQYASSEELYERPADTFVAQFVGHPPMNVFSGRGRTAPSSAMASWPRSRPVAPPARCRWGSGPRTLAWVAALEARVR